FPPFLEFLQVASDMMGPDFVQKEMPNGLAQLFKVNVFRYQCVRLLSGSGQPFFVGLLDVVFEGWTPANVAQPVLAALDQERSEFLLGLRCRLGFQRHPLDRFASGIVFNRDTGNEVAVPLPESANWVLAVIENLGVFVTT